MTQKMSYLRDEDKLLDDYNGAAKWLGVLESGDPLEGAAQAMNDKLCEAHIQTEGALALLGGVHQRLSETEAERDEYFKRLTSMMCVIANAQQRFGVDDLADIPDCNQSAAYRAGALEMLEACIKIIRNPVGDISGGYWLSYANRQLVEGLMRSLPLPNIQDFQQPAAILGRKGGQSRSEAKRAASAENGKRGGRPSKADKPPVA